MSEANFRAMLPRSATLFSQVFQGYAAPSPAWATGACLSSDRWRAEQALQAIWKKSVEWYGMTLETFWVLLSYDERGKTVIPAMTLTASFMGKLGGLLRFSVFSSDWSKPCRREAEHAKLSGLASGCICIPFFSCRASRTFGVFPDRAQSG